MYIYFEILYILLIRIFFVRTLVMKWSSEKKNSQEM